MCFYTLIRLHSAFAHTFFYAEIPLHASTFTQRHFDTHWQARLHANTLTRRCLFCARFLLHALMLLCVTGMLLITHAFTQRYFYTETPLHRDAFAQGCFHTEMIFYIQILLQRDDFTLGKLTHRCQNKQRRFHKGMHLHEELLPMGIFAQATS